nr:phosphoenolpyruvate carboxykinase [Candidatus Freyarchaeota archaeon]
MGELDKVPKQEGVIDVGISRETREELVQKAERHLGYDSIYVWNANINGYIIQLRTNESHLDDFWRENWFPASIERNLRPHGVIYAATGVYDENPGIYYNSETKTGIIFNVNDYEFVRALALGIVADVCEEQERLNFLRGSLVDINGEGVAIMGETGRGVSTNAFLLLELERARIHSDDIIYVEQLGGEKGRISTSVSERKFFLKKDLIKIYPRLQALYEKSKRENSHFMLDPWWIGGNEKYLDTTRIKLIFLLVNNRKDARVAKRLNTQEAIDILTRSPQPFFNPYLLIRSEKRRKLQIDFYKNIFKFAAVYYLNVAHPLLDMQKEVRRIITSKEYLEPLLEEKERAKAEIDEIVSQLNLEEIRQEVENLYERTNVKQLPPERIRKMAEKYGTKTIFNNYNFVSTVKNRSAGLTITVGSPEVVQYEMSPKQKELMKDLPKTMKDVLQYIKSAPLICTERTMGGNPDFTPKCTLFLSVHRGEMIRLAHMVNQTLFDPLDNYNGPHIFIVFIPEWQEKDRQIIVFPEIGVTFVLGTDYYGEAKKGMLRMAMWFAKQQGMLGLHAGAKKIRARDTQTGKIKTYNTLIFGLTATGKTTHSCHTHDLNEADEEGIEIVQDDFVALRPDGSALGTERGFYLKTEGVNPEIQPLIYDAVTKPDAILENVMVDYKGNVLFESDILTGNGRGIMQRDDFGKYKSPTVNLPPLKDVDGLIVLMITRRNTVVPIASKLALEQAAAAFMLGESIETSGSDPKRAGQSVREVGTNPFIVGNKGLEGNKFYDIIKGLGDKVRCYLINTGGVGELRETNEEGVSVVKRKVDRVQIKEMASIIRGIARNNIEWVPEPHFGTLVPKEVEGVDMDKFKLEKYYSIEQVEEMVQQLKKERKEWLNSFPELYEEIKKAFPT